MKATYTSTTFIEDLTKATFTLFISDKCKYTAGKRNEEIEVEYTGVKSWSIVSGGEEAEEIERGLNENDIDDYHEYLILNFEDGTSSTFRNSYVDMFVR